MTQVEISQKRKTPVVDFEVITGEKEIPDLPLPGSFQEKFLNSIMDQSKDYPPPIPVINLLQNNKEVALLTLKSFSLWQGKQKSKKTTVLALMAAAFIYGNIPGQGTHFSGAMEGTVLFFDNEQGESYAARTMKLILKLAGLESSVRLIYCDLRKYTPKERIKIIRAGVENTPNVKLVIIDGLVDLLTDFMDAGEGHAVTTEILTMCSIYDIHIAGVLHQNKNDKNARAHIGTISSQKCEMEISTEIDPDDRTQSLVTCINSRGIPFEPFAIKWEQGALPCIVQDWSEIRSADAKAAKNFQRSQEVADAVFRPFQALSYVQAVEGIMNQEKKSESTAKRMLKNFIIWKMVDKGTDGNYRIRIKDGSQVHEGSNEGS